MKLKPLRSALQGAYQSVKNLMPVSTSIWDDKLLSGLKAELIVSDELIKSQLTLINYLKKLTEDLSCDKKAAVLIMNQLRNDAEELRQDNEHYILNLEAFEERSDELKKEIIALKAIICGIRKQKRYSGQKYYDPNNHKAATIYLCARWNDYYMISIGRYNVPNIITAAEFNETYAGYEIIQSTNQNSKLLKND